METSIQSIMKAVINVTILSKHNVKLPILFENQISLHKIPFLIFL